MIDFLWKPSCKHEKISPHNVGGYCPDCGEYVENQWFITRCSCCGVKQKSIVKNGRVVGVTKFCTNCGSDSFRVEKLEAIDIVNINYAVVIKKVIEYRKRSFIQTWMENSAYTPVKLLPSY